MQGSAAARLNVETLTRTCGRRKARSRIALNPLLGSGNCLNGIGQLPCNAGDLQDLPSEKRRLVSIVPVLRG